VRILAVGSEGNIGGPLVEHLRDVGHEVFETDISPGFRHNYAMADINHPIDLLDAFEWGPDIVYLMAAVVSRVTCEQSGSLAVATNLAGVNNVIALTKRIGARLVFFSTSEVYGPTALPMDEDTSVPRPNNRYGLTKYLGEQLVEYEVRQYGLRAVTVRPFMVYDENEDLGDHRSAMVRFAQRLSEGRPIDVHLGTSRSWLHISDAVIALGRLAGLNGYHVINIGHPKPIETEALAGLVRSCLDASPDLLRFVPQPEQMTPVKIPSLRKQEVLLGMTPKVSIDDGVARVCARFRA
jgi:nucleoside-diphosphate-sugar epimerase